MLTGAKYMQRVKLVRVVFLHLVSLSILPVLLGGCTLSLFNHKIDEAEELLSAGKPLSEQMKVKPDIAPPSVIARLTIARAMDTLLSDKYDENDVQEIRKNLSQIRKDPLLPNYLKTEAGYILILIDKIENLKHQNKISSQQKEKCIAENERLRKELEELKKDQDELKFKLRKIEEIHINTEKKRGAQ